MNFQESRIPDKVESEGSERIVLQVPEDNIYKAAESIKLFARTAPVQLPQFLQTRPEERISVSYPPFSPQGELESKCPMIKELARDSSRTENFWLDVHSYKDYRGNHMV